MPLNSAQAGCRGEKYTIRARLLGFDLNWSPRWELHLLASTANKQNRQVVKICSTHINQGSRSPTSSCSSAIGRTMLERSSDSAKRWFLQEMGSELHSVLHLLYSVWLPVCPSVVPAAPGLVKSSFKLHLHTLSRHLSADSFPHKTQRYISLAWWDIKDLLWFSGDESPWHPAEPRVCVSCGSSVQGLDVNQLK